MNQTLLVLKVRENVVIEDDIQLARHELANLFGGEVHSYRSISEALFDHGHEELLSVIPAFGVPFRGKGTGAFVVTEPRISLGELARRLSYIQEMVVISRDDSSGDSLRTFHEQYAWNSKLTATGDRTILRVIPLFCLLECADILLRYAKVDVEIPRLLDALVADLLSDKPPTGSSILYEVPTRKTSTYLGHNLHIYKAKFFPRMVRSLINAHLRELSGKLLLDPFVGSGTALLEAQMMGLASAGIDLDPLSVTMSQAKVELVSHDPEKLWQTIDQVSHTVGEAAWLQSHGLFAENEPNGKRSRFKLPAIIGRRLTEGEAEQIEEDASQIQVS